MRKGPGQMRGACLALAALLAGGAAAAAEGGPVALVDGTRLSIRLPEGAVLGPEDLVGAVLEAGDGRGRTLTVRIAAVVPDPRDPEGEVLLYRMERLDGDGGWRELCAPDPAGERWAFPLAAAPGEPGTFAITCSAGAVGKCVRLGYKPWKVLPDGTALREHHRACVRMLRADYCGDGTSFTRDGTRIDLQDGLGIQAAEPGTPMRFEAGWGAEGATCIARPRVPARGSLEAIGRQCPGRLAGRLGEACTEERARRLPGTLLLNRS